MYHAMACLTVAKLLYLGEHSEASQTWSLHACSKSRLLYCSLQHFHNYYKVQSSGRKEKEMDLKRKATVKGETETETRRQITLRASKCCKVKSFRSLYYLFMHPFYCTQQFTGCHANH